MRVWYGVKLKSLNCVRLFATPWTIHVTPFTIQSVGFSRQDIGVDSISLSRGVFLTQGSNPGFPHCRWILYQLNHKESTRIPLLQGVFMTQESKQGPLHCRWIFFTNWVWGKTAEARVITQLFKCIYFKDSIIKSLWDWYLH